MAEKVNPGALAGATGAGLPCYAIAAGTLTIAFCPCSGNAFATFAATLDPATLAALGLAGARIWGGVDMNAVTRRTRPRGFAPWNPRPASLALVQDVQAVLADYKAHLPLTIRQVFYRLVATRDFDKTESAYSRLCETANRARRAGLIRFAATLPSARPVEPGAAPYGESVGGRVLTWTGRVVSLDEWRRLSEWERHGQNGQRWCGITRRWHDE